MDRAEIVKHLLRKAKLKKAALNKLQDLQTDPDSETRRNAVINALVNYIDDPDVTEAYELVPEEV